MKTKLGILIVIVLLWCLIACGDIGGGRSVDPNKTHQIDTLPDSLRVKDTSISTLYKFKHPMNNESPYSYYAKRRLKYLDSIRQRKTGQ